MRNHEIEILEEIKSTRKITCFREGGPMKRKTSKVRRKRWMRNRVKAYKRAKFVEGFRNHFVKKGIL